MVNHLKSSKGITHDYRLWSTCHRNRLFKRKAILCMFWKCCQNSILTIFLKYTFLFLICKRKHVANRAISLPWNQLRSDINLVCHEFSYQLLCSALFPWVNMLLTLSLRFTEQNLGEIKNSYNFGHMMTLWTSSLIAYFATWVWSHWKPMKTKPQPSWLRTKKYDRMVSSVT